MLATPAGKTAKKNNTASAYCQTPIGFLRVSGNEKWVQAVEFCEQPGPAAGQHPRAPAPGLPAAG